MIITLTGNNSFLLKKELKNLVADFVKDNGEFALEKLDGEQLEADKLISTVQAVPFLADKRMLVVTDISANKPLAEAIDKVLDNTVDTTDLVFVEPHPDKRSTFYKTLKKRTDFREFNDLDSGGLASWLVSTAKQRGGSISASDANYLIKRVGTNQMLLGNELEKLLNYRPAITKETIDLLTEQTPQGNIFDMLDAAFSGNTKRAIKLYQDQRKQKVEPQIILAMITWQLHIMALVKTAGQRSADQIASEAKIKPYTVGKAQNAARRISLAELKDIIHRTLELDVQLKSITIDADDALEHLIISLKQTALV